MNTVSSLSGRGVLAPDADLIDKPLSISILLQKVHDQLAPADG